jgi:hypothetical protein
MVGMATIPLLAAGGKITPDVLDRLAVASAARVPVTVMGRGGPVVVGHATNLRREGDRLVADVDCVRGAMPHPLLSLDVKADGLGRVEILGVRLLTPAPPAVRPVMPGTFVAMPPSVTGPDGFGEYVAGVDPPADAPLVVTEARA